MTDKQRFEISDSTRLGAMIAGATEVTIKDKSTGNQASGTGQTREEAEKKAWENLKEKQGPPPSQGGS